MDIWNVVVEVSENKYAHLQVEAINMEDACIKALKMENGAVVKVALASYEL